MLLLSLACHKTPPLPDPPSLDERLAWLEATLEAQRVDQHIPGMALGVVVDGEVVLVRGFGVADVATGEPATAQTLFPVGSTTKAFTSALLASRVESGELAWEDPVSEHIPGFSLKEGDGALEDLLSHQTGLTRMPMVWGGGADLSLDQLLEAAGRAEPYGEPGSWHYNNVMYAIAGSLVGDYPAVLQAELLDPLGMTHSSLGLPEGMATGYRLDGADPVPVQTRDLSGVMAPAGGLTSTAEDMVKWVQWQLDQGDTRVADTWAPRADLGAGHYGMGWFSFEEDGLTIIEHGGNIEGFSAQVALLPEQDMGLVWMSNVMVTPMQSTVRSTVVEALLGDDWWKPAGSGDLSAYVGDYDAAFMRETLTVVQKDGGLALDVPGQTVYGLRPPDDEGLWAFKLTKQIKVEFHVEGDEVVGLTMHQGGLTLEAPREGHEAEPEPRYAALTGRYQLDEETVELVVVHGHLALDMPSQLVYCLHEPDDEGLWVFRATPDIALRIEDDAIVILQEGHETRAPRLDAAPDLPSVDTLFSFPPEEPACREEGTVDFVHQGVTGTWVMEWDEHAFASRVDVPSGVDGVVVTDAWVRTFSDFQEDMTLDDPALVAQAWADHPNSLRPDQLTVIGPSLVEGREAWQVLRDAGPNPDETWVVAQDNGDALQRDVQLITPHMAGLRIPQSTRFYDHVEGAPQRVETENVHTGRAVLRTTSRSCDADLRVSTEALPEPAAAPEPPAEGEQDAGE